MIAALGDCDRPDWSQSLQFGASYMTPCQREADLTNLAIQGNLQQLEAGAVAPPPPPPPPVTGSQLRDLLSTSDRGAFAAAVLAEINRPRVTFARAALGQSGAVAVAPPPVYTPIRTPVVRADAPSSPPVALYIGGALAAAAVLYFLTRS